MSGAFIIKDASWVRQAFLVTSKNLSDTDVLNRTFSSASLKYVDTTPGGNLAINPPPQFTRFADIRAPSKFNSGNNIIRSNGMGRYYSEAIDDNAQRIYMRFGVPQFNSLTTFFTSFYNSNAGQIARTGRAGGIFYSIGMAAGFVVSIISWKVVAIHLAGLALRFATGSPSSKFYYLKPTMPVYWTAVTTMVNQLAVNRGIVPRVGGPDQQAFNGKYEFTSDALTQLSQLLPDIFLPSGGIDVYALANRAQRLARKRYLQMQALLDADGNLDITSAIKQVMDIQLDDDKPDYKKYLSTWFSQKPSQAEYIDSSNNTKDSANSSNATLNQGTAAAAGNTTGPQITSPSGDSVESLQSNAGDAVGNDGFWDFFRAELDDGSAFATFRVNATGQMSESFSNSVTESEIAQKINGMSSSSRSTMFDFAGGNLVGGGIIGNTVQAIGTAAKDLIKGIGDGIGISGLAALAGSAFVDIPKHWQSSTASLPRANYVVNLVSPYGNPISQLLNIDLPLAMLLAGALPLATGKQSYTSPFILELYDQGRCQTRLGMIDSLSVTRGTTNLGFNNDGHAMAIDVSFSIVDMSSVLTMPIRENFSVLSIAAGAAAGAVAAGALGAALGGTVGAALGAGVFDDDTVFTDYMAVLAGMNLQDQIYQLRKFKLNLTRAAATWNSWKSPAHFAGMVGDIPPARLLSAIYKGRGSGITNNSGRGL